jgi:hypothetical protein
LWRRRFGADADIIGKSVSLNGSPYVVIGIFGPGFNSEITFLSQLGVALERLQVISYGKERPQCTTSDEECWKKTAASISRLGKTRSVRGSARQLVLVAEKSGIEQKNQNSGCHDWPAFTCRRPFWQGPQKGSNWRSASRPST